MKRQRLTSASRLAAVAAFRETAARQALASAREGQRLASDALDEAERGLDWLEARRAREVDGGAPDPALVAWLDHARDVAGSAYAFRAEQLTKAADQADLATRGWAEARQREERFADRAARLATEARAEQQKAQADQLLESWLTTSGAGQ